MRVLIFLKIILGGVIVNKLKVDSHITFLYFADLQDPRHFFEHTMGFEMVENQHEHCLIYRTAEQAYLGIVDEKYGSLDVVPNSAVLTTFCVHDIVGWYKYLKEKHVKIIRELATNTAIEIRSFFFEGPGGYIIEIQEFCKEPARTVFHNS